jgi:hypothetical protein
MDKKMTLLQIEEIQRGLEREFLPLEPMLTGLRLISRESPVDVSVLVAAEEKLGIKLPREFTEYIARFDFGRLTIGPVAFGSGGDYLKELIETNQHFCWWGGGKRPDNLLMVGNSDPYVLLLNASSGEILAMDRESEWTKAPPIARHFDLFVRGLGTVMLGRGDLGDVERERLAELVSSDAGGRDSGFWLSLAR